MEERRHYRFDYGKTSYYISIKKIGQDSYLVGYDTELDEILKFQIKQCLPNQKMAILPEGPWIENDKLTLQYRIILFSKEREQIDYRKLAEKKFKIVSIADFTEEEKEEILYQLDQIAPKILIQSYHEEFKDYQLKVMLIEKDLGITINGSNQEQNNEGEEWLKKELDRIFNNKR